MIRVGLFDEVTGEIIETLDPYAIRDPNGVSDGRAVLTISPAYAHSTFNSETRTDAGTTTLVTPASNGSLILNDILISGEKQAGSTIKVLFTDGAITETIFNASQVDVPGAFTHSFNGRVQGWRDARIDMTTTGTADATVTVVYTKVASGQPYAEWNALR